MVVLRWIAHWYGFSYDFTDGNSAGHGNFFLTSITLPDSVTTIESWAFANCSKIETLNLGNGLRSIGADAGFFTKKLTSIVFPESFEGWSSVLNGESVDICRWVWTSTAE